MAAKYRMPSRDDRGTIQYPTLYYSIQEPEYSSMLASDDGKPAYLEFPDEKTKRYYYRYCDLDMHKFFAMLFKKASDGHVAPDLVKNIAIRTYVRSYLAYTGRNNSVNQKHIESFVGKFQKIKSVNGRLRYDDGLAMAYPLVQSSFDPSTNILTIKSPYFAAIICAWLRRNGSYGAIPEGLPF